MGKTIDINNQSSTLKKDVLEIALIFLAARVFFSIFMLLSPYSLNEVIKLFDAELYIKIAEEGYTYRNTAFFPVIPLIIKYLGTPSLLIINNCLFLVTLMILKKLGLSRMTLLTVAFSPIGFFSMLLYTEGIYFFLTVTAYYLFVFRKSPLLMGIVLGLGVCTRNSGALLFFAIFIAMVFNWFNKKIKIKDIFIAYIPATIISLMYPVFLQIKFGSWKAFVDVQYSDWIRINSNLFKTIAIQINSLMGNYAYEKEFDAYLLTVINEPITLIIEAFVIGLIILEIVAIVKKSKESKALKIDDRNIILIFYTLATLIALNTTIRNPELDVPTTSFFRYYSSLFPIYIYANKRGDFARLITLAITIMISIITSFFYCNGTFFY